MTILNASTPEVIIQVESLGDAVAFYEGKLGLPVTLRTETLAGFETGAFRLYVEQGTPYGPVFEFLVDDLEASKKALTLLGCTIESEDPSIPRCYVRDPFGLLFNLAESSPARES